MTKIKNIKQNLIMATVALIIAGCGSTPVTQEIPDTASPREEVTKLEADINLAQSKQVDVLSPYNFEKAHAALDDAKKGLDKQRDAKNILKDVAEGRAYLKQSNEFAEVSRTNLGDVAIAREQAIVAGAKTMRPDGFKSTDSQLIDTTSDIEKNDFKAATKNRSKLQLAYLDLELESIKESRLGPVRATISSAVKEGAKNFAPRSLAIAEKSYKDADAFITGNRHDAQVAANANAALVAAEHLLKITRDSKSGKKTSSEDMALQMEGEQLKVVAKQGLLNAKQVQLDVKTDELATKQGQVNRGERANQALTAANSDLESEQAFNKSFEDARAEFTPSEAEVYKQGNKLTIRLRGLEFPVAQAVLKSSNFPLLAKVQNVIKKFGKSSVVVEGHTDSNGGAVLNQKLSTERAKAVSDYLATNNSDQLSNISSVGYGFQKPLATNKTASGRAQNRRVDILIQPAPEASSRQ